MPRKAVRIYAKWNEAVGPWLGDLDPKGASLSETILSRVVDVRIQLPQKLHLLEPVIFATATAFKMHLQLCEVTSRSQFEMDPAQG